MNVRIQTDRLRVFVILRLFIVTLLLFLAHYGFRLEGLFFYYIIAIVCFLSLIYLFWLIYGKYLNAFTWIQILSDIFLETLLIHYTGGVDSLFVPIYVLSILSGGILIAPWASFVIAGVCSIAFSILVILNYFGMMEQWISPMTGMMVEHDSLYLFYATYVRITIFFVVAILTNYMTNMILKLEEKIKVQERLAFLGDITSAIAHEIRNPLAAISNSVEVLALDLKTTLTSKNEKLMQAIIEESDRLKRTFGKILHYSKIGELKSEKYSLKRFIDRVLLLVGESKEFPQSVEVIKKYGSKDVQVEIDFEEMTDVFMNLIRNAYEAMPKGGVLMIDFTDTGNQTIEIILRDTGEGIKKEFKKNLFVPFKTTKKMGTGLGLAQAQKILSAHGGKITIHSLPKNGTEVRIFLRKS